MNLSKSKRVWAACLWALTLAPGAVQACSVCYGDPDSNASKGLGWGVVALLGVVMTVLGGITTFFVYIAKKSPTDQTR